MVAKAVELIVECYLNIGHCFTLEDHNFKITVDFGLSSCLFRIQHSFTSRTKADNCLTIPINFG